MSWTPPTEIRANDQLSIRRSHASDVQTIYTFADTLNQGTLFERPPSVYRHGARDHRLFELINRSHYDTLIATLIIQDDKLDKIRKHRLSEVGGLVVHPGARGLGLAGIMTRIAMLHDLVQLKGQGWTADYRAYFIKGNTKPEEAFRETGFRPDGELMVHPGDVDASLEHMLKDGAKGVAMTCVKFDPGAIPELVSWYEALRRNNQIHSEAAGFPFALDLTGLEPEMDVSRL